MHLLTTISAILSLTAATAITLPSTPSKRDSTVLTCNNRGTHWHGWSSIHKIFSFGDSYTTTNFQVTGAQPNTTYPYGNPPYVQNGTSADGPNWIENLVTGYNQSFIELFNFAVGGAAVDKSLTHEIYDIVPDFTEQVANTFLPYYAGVGNRSANWSSDHVLFTAFFGINDLSM